MAKHLTDNWQIAEILTDNWHLYPAIHTLINPCSFAGKELEVNG